MLLFLLIIFSHAPLISILIPVYYRYIETLREPTCRFVAIMLFLSLEW